MHTSLEEFKVANKPLAPLSVLIIQRSTGEKVIVDTCRNWQKQNFLFTLLYFIDYFLILRQFRARQITKETNVTVDVGTNLVIT